MQFEAETPFILVMAAPVRIRKRIANISSTITKREPNINSNAEGLSLKKEKVSCQPVWESSLSQALLVLTGPSCSALSVGRIQ